MILTATLVYFTPENVGSALGGLAGSLLSPILYPYLFVVPVLANLVFIAGAHLAIRRTMGVWGQYRDLMQTFLYIVNAAILFLIPYLFLLILAVTYISTLSISRAWNRSLP